MGVVPLPPAPEPGPPVLASGALEPELEGAPAPPTEPLTAPPALVDEVVTFVHGPQIGTLESLVGHAAVVATPSALPWAITSHTDDGR